MANQTSTPRLTPSKKTLHAVLTTLYILVTATIVLGAQPTPTLASEPSSKSAASFDFAKIADREIIAGTGITLKDLGEELAPLAIDMLARGFPPLGILKDIFKSGLDIKVKIEAKAQRVEDIARVKAIDALLLKVSIAMAEESERQAVRFDMLREDNRKTHAELADAKALLEKAAESNLAIAAAVKQLQAKHTPAAKTTIQVKSAAPAPRSENDTFLGIRITKQPDWAPFGNGS